MSAYQEVIVLLGDRHEKEFLSNLNDVLDLSNENLEARIEKTKSAIEEKCPCIYQGAFSEELIVSDQNCRVFGIPDFLIFEDGGYKIVDAKLSRRISERDHPEILRQLELYGWLYETTTNQEPKRLQVYSGKREIEDVAYDKGLKVLEDLKELVELKLTESLKKTPVGWSKCSACSFHNLCWSKAEEARDVSLVPDVDQGLALALYEKGINTYDALVAEFDEQELFKFQRPWGKKLQRVGKKAGNILKQSACLANNSEEWIANPELPQCGNYVMFDLEGIPPQLETVEKVYLWGLQVYGETNSDFLGCFAEFGEEGDLLGWQNFLSTSKRIFDEYGDIPFVHWHHYERVKIDMYIERFGDIDGIADKVKSNLLDLLPVLKSIVILPVPSYSLKVIEKYIGFKRTQDEFGGDWSIAKFIHATETEDKVERDKIVNELITYNQEDLDATWAVFDWLKSKAESAL